MSKIVNWSCYATLWDRIIVEGVKRAQFEDKIENGNLKDKELAEYVGRMRSQDVVLDELKKEFIIFMKEAISKGFDFYDEKRTFN